MARKSRTAPKTIASEEKKRLAVRLRQAGKSYREIEDATGISKSQCHRLVDAALKDLRKEIAGDAETLLALELARLDELQAAIYARGLQGDPVAIDKILKIMDRRAKLLNLDKQVNRVEISGVSMPEFNPADEWTDEDEKALDAEFKVIEGESTK